MCLVAGTMASQWSLDLVVISVGQLGVILSDLGLEAATMRRAMGRATSDGLTVSELLQQHGENKAKQCHG